MNSAFNGRGVIPHDAVKNFLARMECDETVRMGVKPPVQLSRRERRAIERRHKKNQARWNRAPARTRELFFHQFSVANT